MASSLDQRPHLVASLSTAELRAGYARMEQATAALWKAFAAERPDAEAVRQALTDGALFECLKNPLQRKTTLEWGKRNDLWQHVIDTRRLDLFEALLDADAARAQRDTDTPCLVGRVAVQAPPAFLDALLARSPALNAMGPTPFLNHNQPSTCLVAPLMLQRDDILDRLLDAGASPPPSLPAPVYESAKTPPYAPLSLLHLARTPHAIRRLLAAGLDVDALDEYGRSALAIVFDGSLPRFKPGDEANERERERQMAQRLLLTRTLMDAGASTTFHLKDAVRSAFASAMTRALDLNEPALIAFLIERGERWPDDVVPDGPVVVERLVRLGVGSPLPEAATRWLTAWMSGTFGFHQEEQVKALETLVAGGFPLDGLDEASGLTPLMAALQSGDYERLKVLIACGLPIAGHPPGHPNPLATWKQVLAKTVSEGVGGVSAHENWAKLKTAHYLAQKKDRLRDALKALGHNPSLLAGLQAQMLDRHLDGHATAEGARTKPRL